MGLVHESHNNTMVVGLAGQLEASVKPDAKWLTHPSKVAAVNRPKLRPHSSHPFHMWHCCMHSILTLLGSFSARPPLLRCA